ncbi:MAG: hypothetical protein ACOYNC_04195 [Bacteroidales bacterium]
MISCYEELWPEHPFTFRIPFQDSGIHAVSENREYVQTPGDIKGTILKLLEDIDDEEWVYWCIDDKYPIELKLNRIKAIYQSITHNPHDRISSVLFCRARRMLDPNYLTTEQQTLGDELLLERKAYHQIWIHQFIRVKVLRFIFTSFPDIIERAEVMDDMKDRLKKPVDHKLYVTASNCAVFGESSFKGVITGNCLASLISKGFSIPSWQPSQPSSTSIFGEL